MNGKEVEQPRHTTDGNTITESPYSQGRRASLDASKKLIADKNKVILEKKKKNAFQSIGTFLYDPRRKTVLGRSALNWAKLSAFYTVFYFCLGCFFVGLLYVFFLIIDLHEPTYFNGDSTMAVRTSATVVGLGFRPQPSVDESLIRITNDPDQQNRMFTSLRLFRDVFLTQKSDGKVKQCSSSQPALSIPDDTACAFNWDHIVDSPDHPCSDKNMYGFKTEEPCVLIKLNKIYGWTPDDGPLPYNIPRLGKTLSDISISDSDVYITCEGTSAVDNDVLNDLTYYSLAKPSRSSKYGVIPSYFFPYRNAKDHVQPFILVQFKSLPLDRLISVTCRAWAPGIEHDVRAMRGMVNFQLYRSHKNI